MTETTKNSPPSILIVVFWNLVLLGLLTLGAWFSAPAVIAPCVFHLWRDLSLALIVFILIHLFWHQFGERIRMHNEPIEIFGLKISIGVLVDISDVLHPRMPSRVVWGIAVILSAPAVAILFSWIQLPLQEPVPVVRSFRITYPDETMQVRRSGEQIEIPTGMQVMVEGELLQPASIHCNWSTIHGMLLPAEGCATHYQVPLIGNIDTLNLHVQSACRTQNTYATLHIVMPASQ